MTSIKYLNDCRELREVYFKTVRRLEDRKMHRWLLGLTRGARTMKTNICERVLKKRLQPIEEGIAQ